MGCHTDTTGCHSDTLIGSTALKPLIQPRNINHLDNDNPNPSVWGNLRRGPHNRLKPMPDNTITVNQLAEQLTDKQKKLAELIVLEGLERSAAIDKAGYASKSMGYATLRKTHVLEYVQALVREHLTESSILAVQTVRKLMSDSRSDYVKLQAAQDVLDRSGFKPVERHAHLHGGQVHINIDLS